MKARLTVLGSGTSMGVPTIGCDCAVCQSIDPHDRRTRPSLLIEYSGKNVLIDTGPDFREQAIREKIRHLVAVLIHPRPRRSYFRPGRFKAVKFRASRKIPLYARPADADLLRRMFRYIFDENYKAAGLAQVELHEISGTAQFVWCAVPAITK